MSASCPTYRCCKKLSDEDVSAEEIQELVEAAREDLARDKSFQDITFVRGAKFRVRYERQGDILNEKSFNFVRFNSRFFSMHRLEDGTVRIVGNRPPQSYVPQLRKMGLRPNGIFRVWTSANAVDNNAAAVEGEAKRVYAWILTDLTQPPHLSGLADALTGFASSPGCGPAKTEATGWLCGSALSSLIDSPQRVPCVLRTGHRDVHTGRRGQSKTGRRLPAMRRRTGPSHFIYCTFS